MEAIKEKMMAQVTVIVPIYNVEKYLRTCFESLLAQTSRAFTVLAVNDGSPDNSQAIIDEYIDVCFWYIRRNWPEFPKCRYPVLREKYDWIYARKPLLKAYLAWKRLRRR